MVLYVNGTCSILLSQFKVGQCQWTNWSHASEEIGEVTQTCIIKKIKLTSLDKPDKNIWKKIHQYRTATSENKSWSGLNAQFWATTERSWGKNYLFWMTINSCNISLLFPGGSTHYGLRRLEWTWTVRRLGNSIGRTTQTGKLRTDKEEGGSTIFRAPVPSWVLRGCRFWWQTLRWWYCPKAKRKRLQSTGEVPAQLEN